MSRRWSASHRLGRETSPPAICRIRFQQMFSMPTTELLIISRVSQSSCCLAAGYILGYFSSARALRCAQAAAIPSRATSARSL